MNKLNQLRVIDMLKGTLLFVFTFIILNSALSQKKKDEFQIEDTLGTAFLNKFYLEYITIKANDNSTEKEIEFITSKYCSKSFIKRLKKSKLDYDILLNANDFSIIWLSTLKVTKENNYFIVSYEGSTEAKDGLVKIKVILKKNKNQIKIDSVEK